MGAAWGGAARVWAAKAEAKHAERAGQDIQAQDAQGRAYKKGLALYPRMTGGHRRLVNR